MKKIIKRNYKILIGIIIGSIITCSSVYAAIILQGTEVGYTDTYSMGATNAQEAIDKLYELLRTKQKITAWEYHETGSNRCINGEEDTCVKTTCYKSGSTCSMGTIIKYYVNDNVFHYFYVLRDNGTTITMQQRENTVRNIAWTSRYDYVASGGDGDYYDSANNGSGTVYGRNNLGPITILRALEQATSTWTNVNILSYEPGVTTLYQNAYTGCTYSGGSSGTYLTSCGTNTYTSSSLGTRTSRARMITVLEASATGCLVWKDGAQYTNIMGNSINAYNHGSCPDYMHNYLVDSTSYGGSYKDNTKNVSGTYDYGYWTMSASSSNSTYAWSVNYHGRLYYGNVSDTHHGARAVVEITK